MEYYIKNELVFQLTKANTAANNSQNIKYQKSMFIVYQIPIGD